MKKIVFALAALAAALLASVSASAASAALPTFDVRLNGALVKSEYREYPLLVYKDITYFPMTYFDCRFLGLTTDWDNEARSLSVKKADVAGMYHDYASEKKNDKSFPEPEICDFNIRVNGENIVSSKEEYPLITFRDVTYFPLTWRFAHDMFGWEYSFDEKNGLAINSDTYNVKTLELRNASLSESPVTDGEYYYYRTKDDAVSRAAVGDTSKTETVFELPEGWTGLKFARQNGSLYFSFHTGGPTMGSNHYYKIENGAAVKTDEGDQNEISGGNRRRLDLGGGVTVAQSDLGNAVDVWDVRFNYNGREFPLEKDNVAFGSARLDGKQELVLGYQRLGDYIYMCGMDRDSKADSALYRADINTGGITKLHDGVGRFYVCGDYLMKNIPDAYLAVYERGGNIYRFSSVSGEEELLLENRSLLSATADLENLLLIVKNGGKTEAVAISDNLVTGRRVVKSKDTLFETEAQVVCESNDSGVWLRAVEELPDEDVRFAVFGFGGKRFRPFFSAEMVSSAALCGQTLIYVSDDKAAAVTLDKPFTAAEKDGSAAVAEGGLPVMRGTCGENGGDNAQWEVTGSTLRIFGKGKMADYFPVDNDHTYPAPWYPYSDRITGVAVEEGITTVGLRAFAGMDRLVNASLPEGLTEIKFGAFDGCKKLETVNLPSTLKEIGDFAFCESVVKHLDLPAGLEVIGGSAFSRSGLAELYIPDGVSIGASILRQCPNLERVRLPEGLTSLPDYTYILYDCQSLTEVELPDSLEELGSYAIFNCPKLKKIELGKKLKKLGYNFSDCGIESLSLPDGLTAFNGPKEITYFCAEGSPSWQLLTEQGFEPAAEIK